MLDTVSLSAILVILAGVLVMLMQGGFALLVMGLCRAKNAAQVITMNLVLCALSVIGFWVCGFALLSGGVSAPNGERGISLFGHSFGFMGHRGFFLRGLGGEPEALCRFFFQAAVVTVAALIPAGAMAERWKFSSMVPYGLWSAAL